MSKPLIKFIVILLLVSAIGVSLIFLPVKDYVTGFLSWVQGTGPLGPIVLGVVYIFACVLFVPGSLLTLGAGFAFGVIVGTITISIASTLGASAAFLLGRTLLRDWVATRVAGNPRFSAIDTAVGRQGFKIVFLIRLSPAFPFNLLNYMFGLTKVSFWHHFFASWLGMLPGTIMYVYIGSAMKSLADIAAGNFEGGVAQKVLFGVGLLATIVVTVLITRIAKQALQDAVTESKGQSTALGSEGARHA